MNARLEQYVEAIASQIRGMSEEARQSELEELRQHLNSLVAEQEANGKDSEAATEAAIRQFGAAREVGEMLNPTSLRRRLQALPENVVTVLYCLTILTAMTLTTWYAVGPFFRMLLPLPPLQPGFTIMERPQISWYALYPHLLGLTAFFLVLKRDGLQRFVVTLSDTTTATGAGVRWIALFCLTAAVVSHITLHLYDFQIATSIGRFVQPSVALLAGGIVARVAPRQALKGVYIAAATLTGTPVFYLLCYLLLDSLFSPGIRPLISGELLVSMVSVTGLAYGGVLANRWTTRRS